MIMELYLLTNTEETGWDENAGFVIREESAVAARKIAAQKAGDEGAELWLDVKKSSCKTLKQEGTEGMILQDFNAG